MKKVLLSKKLERNLMQSVECITVKITIVTVTPLRGKINQNIHCACDATNKDLSKTMHNGSIICKIDLYATH